MAQGLARRILAIVAALELQDTSISHLILPNLELELELELELDALMHNTQSKRLDVAFSPHPAADIQRP
jgi:hypothetical protein